MQVEIVSREAAHQTAATVAQTTAAQLTTTKTPCRVGIRVWSPNGDGGSVTNTDDIALGYSGLTLANAVEIIKVGQRAFIPCLDASRVYVVSASASQTLRWEVV